MRARPFTPTKESPQTLDDRTVGREQLLAILHERLTAAATSRSRPHTLLVGLRGSGKTHVLEVALHRARLDPRLEPRLAIARISEDAVAVTRFTDLLTEAGRALRLALPRSRDPIELEQALSAAVGDRVLVLVVENLDRVFDTIGRGGQQDLRSWVETSGQVLLLAATPGLSTDFTDRAKPWFGGMIREPVEDLTAEQGRDLLTRLATEADDEPLAQLLRSDVGRARVEAVSRLTGGSPRIWMILAGCVSVDSLDELLPAVEDLLEGLVPYYQQMLFDLPPNHRMLVQELAEGDVAALTPTELAERTALSHQTVTKALELLHRGRWVIGAKIPGGDRRRTLYSLREPMLRHHFQYRSSSEPLALMVGMLRSWFAPRERHRHLAQAPAASFPDHETALGPTHPDTLATRRSIAVMLGRTGRFADALAQAPDEGTAGGIVLDAVRHAEEPPMPDPHIVNQLWRAVRGDEEAMARLPSELLVVARGLRAELAEADARTP